MTTRIARTGSYMPEQIVTNDDLVKTAETNDEWTRSRTRIGARRVVTNEGTSHMAAEASVNVLENAGVEPSKTDLTLPAILSSDCCSPGGACGVQDGIGAVNAACFGVSAARTDSVYTLDTAHAFIGSGIYKATLVIGTDALSKLIDWTDRGTCVLFGDGAGVVVVKADETGILEMDIYSDGTRGGVLTRGSRANGNFLLGEKLELKYMTMDGQEIFKFAVEKVPQCIIEVLEDIGMKVEDVRYFTIYQANYRTIEFTARRLKVNVDRLPVSMEHYGNTSGASVPILLDELSRKGTLPADDKVVLSGFGMDLTWGVTPLER